MKADVLAKWDIHETLGHDFAGELVTYDVELPRELPAGFALLDEKGNQVAVQMLERRTGSSGEKDRARFAMITDLPAFGHLALTLRSVATVTPAPSPGELHVRREGERVELGTDKVGVVLPSLTRTWAKGIPLTELPAPILAMRGIDGKLQGRGWLTGEDRVRAMKTEILGEGPVLAWARVSYELEGGASYKLDLRVPAGQSVVLIREECDGQIAGRVHLCLAAGRRPTHVWTRRGVGAGGTFIEEGARLGADRLTPAQMHWLKSCASNIGVWTESGPASPFVGLFPRFLSTWTHPWVNFIDLAWLDGEGLVAELPMGEERQWALMTGERKAMIGDLEVPEGRESAGGTAKEPGVGPLAPAPSQDSGRKAKAAGQHLERNGPPGAVRVATKWGETPLDKIKDWTLDWGAVRYSADKHYDAPLRRRGSMPYFADLFLTAGQKWDDTYIHVHQTWTGEGDAWKEYLADVTALPESQQLAMRAAAAFVEYKQADRDYWPWDYWVGPKNPNMIMMGESALVLGALALKDHPSSEVWLQLGTAAANASLVSACSPDGAWIECPGYDGAGIGPLLKAALALHDAGSDGLLSDGRLLSAAMCHVAMMTPPDPRIGMRRHLPELGDSFDLRKDETGTRVRPTYWEKLVSVIAKSKPVEAGRILWSVANPSVAGAVVPEGNSRQIAGFGAIFRHAFATKEESYLAIHQDSFSYGHYHDDLGALYLFARGAPLCVDWPTFSKPEIEKAWEHSAVSVGRDENPAYKGYVQTSALTSRADYTVGRTYYDLDAPPPDSESSASVPPHCWQRQVLWIKPDGDTGAHAVVRDLVTDDKPTDWNLWILADGLELARRSAIASGTYGVNLGVTFFVGPDEVPSTEVRGFGDAPSGSGWKYLMQQNVVRMTMPRGGDYGAVLYPYKPGEHPPLLTVGPEGTLELSDGTQEETVLVFPTPKEVSIAGISMTGRAGVVLRGPNRTELDLLDGSRLAVDGVAAVNGDGPASLVVQPGTCTLASDGPARRLVVELGSRVGASQVKVARSSEPPKRVVVDVPEGRHTQPVGVDR